MLYCRKKGEGEGGDIGGKKEFWLCHHHKQGEEGKRREGRVAVARKMDWEEDNYLFWDGKRKGGAYFLLLAIERGREKIRWGKENGETDQARSTRKGGKQRKREKKTRHNSS